MLYYLPERAKIVSFIVYMKGTNGVIVRSDSTLQIKSLMDFCGLRATAAASMELRLLEEQNRTCQAIGKAPMEIMATPGGPSGPRLLTNDRVDIYFGPSARQAFDTSLFKLAYVYTSDFKVGLILQKGRQALAQAVVGSMRVLQANGTETMLTRNTSWIRRQVCRSSI